MNTTKICTTWLTLNSLINSLHIYYDLSWENQKHCQLRKQQVKYHKDEWNPARVIACCARQDFCRSALDKSFSLYFKNVRLWSLGAGVFKRSKFIFPSKWRVVVGLECEKVERDFCWRGTEQKKLQGCLRPWFKWTLKGKHNHVNSLKLVTIGLSGNYFGARKPCSNQWFHLERRLSLHSSESLWA